MKTVSIRPEFTAWREAARQLLAEGWPPESVFWQEQGAGQTALLPVDALLEGGPATQAPRVPRAFLEMARHVACVRDPDRWSLLYRLLWRLNHGERHLMEVTVDPDVHRLVRLDKGVRRDLHKMHAFVRFRRIEQDGSEWYIAWHRPDHAIVELAAPFFVERFGSMCWTILTPDRSATWDGTHLEFGPGAPVSAAPEADQLEDLWRVYYRSIFNPARIKLNAMRAEMPKKHWPTLPETAILTQLLNEAPRRIEAMIQQQLSAAPFLPDDRSLPSLRRAAAQCQGCELWKNASQTVFGEGPPDARLVLVGEQPGDQEDREGQPFLGPAGQLLDRALESAGLDRGQIYLTNSVKHFKWKPQGKIRLHQRPGWREVQACGTWLVAELEAIRPTLIGALGATAGQALLGRRVVVAEERGRFLELGSGARLLLTTHPAAILRTPEGAAKERAYGHFVEDLTRLAAELRQAAALPSDSNGLEQNVS